MFLLTGSPAVSRTITVNCKDGTNSLCRLLVFFALVAEIPCLDYPALRGIDVIFVADLLDAHADAVLGEDDVLLAHALRRRLLHLGDAEVDLVAYPAADDDDDEENDKGDELPGQNSQGWACDDIE